MMGLGSGRRGMKSPPLLIAVLLACVFVLGINYWITSSRCVELQSRVMELEGRMRRAAAERGAVEMKKNEYEDMLAKQKTQIDTIQSLHSSQMRDVHSQCNSEKDSLLNNMTNKDNLLQNLQVQSSNLYKRLEESQLEIKELQESQTKKLSYELAQCSSKITEVKEQCEERLRKAGVKEGNTVNENTEKSVKPTAKQALNQQKDGKKDDEKPQTNPRLDLTPPSKDIKKDAILPPENKEAKHLELNVEASKPSAAPLKPKQEVENRDYLQEPGNQIVPNNVNPAGDEDEPKVEDAEYKESDKENEEMERENLINKDGQPEDDDKGPKQNEQEEGGKNPNDYNGDETNVAESEAEKQAQLADHKQNLKDVKVLSGLNGKAADQISLDRHKIILK